MNKGYETYKASNADWLGEIPNHWNVGKLKWYLRREEPRNPGGVQVLSLYRDYGIVPKDSRDDNYNVTSDDTSNYKYVRRGDFVVNKMKAWQGSVAVSEYEGVVSPAYYVYHFIDETFERRYFHYLIRGCYKEEFMRLSGGIRIGQWDLSSSELDNVLVLIPPMNEQIKIANYIDKKCNEINSIIEKTRLSIEAYKNWKAALIEESVTRGIRGERPIKDVKLNWISQIPEEWSVSRLKYEYEFGKGLPITKDNLVESGVPVISYGQIHGKYNPGTRLVDELFRFVSKEYLDSNRQSLVNVGDLLVADTSEDLAGCGNAVFVDKQMELFAGYHTIILKPKKLKSKYIAYLMLTDAWRSQIRSKATGVKLFSVSKKILNETTLIIPTDEEQDEIVNFLDEKCDIIDGVICDKERLVDELEKYKKSLIFECVTGKRKVV